MSEAAKQEAACPQCSSRSLVRKLAEVMGEVERIAKNGRNDHFGYDFATEADIAQAVRGEMAKRHLMMFPDVVGEQWEKVPRKNGGETKLCTLTVEFTVEDGDSGEKRVFKMKGQGEDPMDKATYKALTGAEKFALLKLFLIPTGHDPERDSDVRHTPGRAPPAQDTRPPLPTPQAVLGIEPAALLRDKSTLVTYGNNKGQYFCDLSDKDLDWHLKRVGEDVAKNEKPQFHKSNLARLGAIQAEKVRRLYVEGQTTGRLDAPAATSPRQAALPIEHHVEPDTIDEEIVTPIQAMWRLGRKHGKAPQEITQFALGAIGKATGFTHADVAEVEQALGAVKK